MWVRAQILVSRYISAWSQSIGIFWWPSTRCRTRSWQNGLEGVVFLGWIMYSNAKKTEDDTGNCSFVVGGVALSTSCKRNKATWDILGLKVAWVNLLTWFVGCSAANTRGIYYGTVSSFGKIAYKVLDTLELWCIWGSKIDIETVDGVHEIRYGILHNM